jgi:hypothetical protein
LGWDDERQNPVNIAHTIVRQRDTRAGRKSSFSVKERGIAVLSMIY